MPECLGEQAQAPSRDHCVPKAGPALVPSSLVLHVTGAAATPKDHMQSSQSAFARLFPPSELALEEQELPDPYHHTVRTGALHLPSIAAQEVGAEKMSMEMHDSVGAK